MSDANVVKTVVSEDSHVGAVEGRPGVTVVIQENFKEFVDEKLGVKEGENPDPEAEAAAELEKIDADKAEKAKAEAGPKEGDVDGSKVFFKGKWVGKHDFNYRLHVQTEVKTKEAETAKAEAEKKVRTAEEARIAAESREALLKAKYEPPKGDLGPEPEPAQFTSIEEYRKAIKTWQSEKTTREFEQKQVQQQQETERKTVQETWEKKVAQAKIDLPDYEEVVGKSTVRISPELEVALKAQAENGPAILRHLAANPDVAESIGKMTIGRMLIEVGRLDVKMGGQAKPGPKSELPETTPKAEISQAPAPISPLRGASAPVGTLKGSDEVPKGMTYDDWKKLWEAGKIK